MAGSEELSTTLKKLRLSGVLQSLDVRVRERNLRAGLISEKDVEKHVAGLADLADQVETFALAQPALDEAAADDIDEGDDEDDADEGAPE